MRFWIILVWLSGALFAGGAWQLEIVNLRIRHDEPYSLPFFIVTTEKTPMELKGEGRGDFKRQHQHSFWGDVWIGVIVLSYILLLLAMILQTR